MVEQSVEKRWSDKEKIAAGILLGVLALFSTFLGLMLVAGITGGGCGGGGLVVPCSPREALDILSSNMNSSTNMTLQIINVGPAAITLIAYYVKTGSGQTYADTAWTGPTIQPNVIGNINVLIDGQAFTFQAHSSYSVTVITSKSDEFTFTAQS